MSTQSIDELVTGVNLTNIENFWKFFQEYFAVTM